MVINIGHVKIQKVDNREKSGRKMKSKITRKSSNFIFPNHFNKTE